jgi:hypothetical protein
LSVEDEDSPRRRRLWGPVDPAIWRPGPPRGKLGRLAEYVVGIFTFSGIGMLVVLGPLSVFLSAFLVYSIVGSTVYFGPTFIGLWAVMIVTFVLVLEKTGYARNFEASTFPLGKRLVGLSVAFMMILGILLAAVTLLRTH